MPVRKQNIYDTGHNYLNKGGFTSALEVFKLYVSAFPKSRYSFESLALAQVKLGNKQEAINNYRKVLELNSENEKAKKAFADLQL